MTKKTKALLSTEIDANVTSSVADDSISPADVGGGMKDIVDSMEHVDDAVDLSDTAPRSVSTGANAAGTAAEAPRRDHHHQVPGASTTQQGIIEIAVNAEALDDTEILHER